MSRSKLLGEKPFRWDVFYVVIRLAPCSVKPPLSGDKNNRTARRASLAHPNSDTRTVYTRPPLYRLAQGFVIFAVLYLKMTVIFKTPVHSILLFLISSNSLHAAQHSKPQQIHATSFSSHPQNLIHWKAIAIPERIMRTIRQGVPRFGLRITQTVAM